VSERIAMRREAEIEGESPVDIFLLDDGSSTFSLLVMWTS